MKQFNILWLSCLALLVLSGCSEIQLGAHLAKQVPFPGDTRPTTGDFKVGNPYTIKGVTYYPKESYSHTQTGLASWYGPGFHGKRTANGEIFNRNELTAAHKTLQMPSMVRVTNLENGRSLVVRINDRGPYAHGRIIDLSEKAAELLGMKNKGTAKVRIDVMEQASRIVASAARRGLSTRGSEIALNQSRYRRRQYETVNGDQPILMAERHPLAYWKQGMELPVPEDKPGGNRVVVTTASAVRPASLPEPDNDFESILLKNASLPRKPVSSFSSLPAENALYPDHQIVRKPVMAAAASKNIFIEIGSFMREDNALTLKNALYTIEEPVSVLRKADGSRIYYKVQIGPVATVEKADKILNMLIRQGRDAKLVMASR